MRAHIAAIAAVAQTVQAGGQNLPVYDSAAIKPDNDPRNWAAVVPSTWSIEFPYIMLSGANFPDVSAVYSRSKTYVKGLLNVTYVGTSANQVRWLIEQVRPTLTDSTPTVSGFTTELKFRSAAVGPNPDFDVTLADGRNVFMAVDQFDYFANPT